MRHAVRKSNTLRANTFEYNELERRQLLAVIISGTAGNDNVAVTYVGTNIVNVTVNEVVLENLDISSGLRFNLKGGANDRIVVDHRIEANIQVVNTEELVLDGGNNQWQVGFIPDRPPAEGVYLDSNAVFPGVIAGRVNNNITFAGTSILRSGNGIDTFTVNTDWSYYLSIYGGDGNDLFRISKAPTNDVILFYGVMAYGEGGHDTFVYRSFAGAKPNGGVGIDTLDYHQTSYDAAVTINDIVGGQWEHGIDKIIGAENRLNAIVSRSLSGQSYKLDWIINGATTSLKESSTGASLELTNFSQFYADPAGIDRFFLKQTFAETKIYDADWVQISSDTNPDQGNLDLIDHDVVIARSAGSTNNRQLDVVQLTTGGALTIEPFDANDRDGIVNPQVIISDATGNGAFAMFGPDKTIIGLTAGKIRFVNELETAPGIEPPAYLPNIKVFGSNSFADTFVIKNIWSPTQIHSSGGDDIFMLGSTNLDANGNLSGIRNEISLFAGAGTDRLFANDQSYDERPVSYEITGESIRDVAYAPVTSAMPPFIPVYYQRHADIRIEGSLEVARVNGPTNKASEFIVSPSVSTKFLVDSVLQTNLPDILSVSGFADVRTLYQQNGAGAWSFENQAQPVYFYGIENLTNRRFDPLFPPPPSNFLVAAKMIGDLDALPAIDEAFETI